MNPRKAREFYKEVAQELGLNEELVKDMLEFYWSEVRKTLSEMKYHAVNVHNLGTFRIKDWKLKEAIVEYERILEMNDGKSFQKMAIRYSLIEKIEKLKRAHGFIEKDKEKRAKFIKEKYERIKSNMEQQKTDSTGSEKLDVQNEPGGEDVSKPDGDM